KQITAVRWMDRREVCMLTTQHSDTMRQTRKQDGHTKQQTEKPHCVNDYNKNMGAVDRTDTMITSIESVRKSLKSYRSSKNYHIPRQTSKRGRPSDGDQPLRLREHFPSPVPPTPKKKYPNRHCHVCSNTTTGERRRRESRYMCAKCNSGLCVHPYFKKYHTLQHF
ncbi:hypothetical protein B7P43_G16808, partial [Cryptotermes secundus]